MRNDIIHEIVCKVQRPMCMRYDDYTVEPGSVRRYLTPRRGLDNVGFIGEDFLDVRCQRRQQMLKVRQKVEM